MPCFCERCQDATWPPQPDCCPRCDGVIARREQERQAENDMLMGIPSHPEGASWAP